MDTLTKIQVVSVWILPIIFAITVHEVAHGYIAYLLGDKTAKMLGRLTLNPIKHVDIFGTVIIPIILLYAGGIILGWAKPVPVNARNLAKPKRDLALIAVAGPLANFIMMFIWAAIAKISLLFGPPVALIYFMGGAGIQINLMLLLLNLLPIPPLDGGHILIGILPRNLAARYERIRPYGFFILLALLMFGVLNVFTPVIQWSINMLQTMFGIGPF